MILKCWDAMALFAEAPLLSDEDAFWSAVLDAYVSVARSSVEREHRRILL